MRRLRALGLFGAAISTSLMVAACGGGGDDGGERDQRAEIAGVIETVVLGDDPATCRTLRTQRFVEQQAFELGDAAVRDCEEDAADTSNDPQDVDVRDVLVDGDEATAALAVTGGPYDGSTLDLALVKEGDQWKLDRFTGFEHLEVETLKRGFIEELESTGQVPPAILDCIRGAIERTSAEQIKQAVVSGTEGALFSLFESCIPRTG
jgi:hypothetical protein